MAAPFRHRRLLHVTVGRPAQRPGLLFLMCFAHSFQKSRSPEWRNGVEDRGSPHQEPGSRRDTISGKLIGDVGRDPLYFG
jgi:hypothetical protein